MQELELIRWLRGQGDLDPSVVEVGPGDDCAVLRVGGERLLVTTDQVLDGVHLSLTRHGPAAAGRKAAARNLSDIAAMAGRPLAMVATVAAPADLAQADAQAIYEGLRAAADEFACPLVGGDVAAWVREGDHLVVSVTAFGLAGGVEPVRRSGAKVGDAVCVTGRLGGAWRGRRHLSFTPRIAEARALAEHGPLTAMIDVSDGLARDLAHVCEASGVAAELEADAIPLSDEAAAEEDPLAAALHDGEDYELLFTLPAEAADGLAAHAPFAAGVTRIGTIAAGSGLTLLRGGRREALEPRGWEHGT
jgi:thiamine-monophosphate kinase